MKEFANATMKGYNKVSDLGTKLNNKINAMAEKSQNAISNFFGKTKNKLGDKLSDFGMKARSLGVKYAEVPVLAMPGGGSIGRPLKIPVGVGINQTKLDNLRQIKANKAVNLNARSVANKVDDVAEDLARSASRNKSSQLNHTTSEAGNHQGASEDTGTVWDKIKETQPPREGTTIPKSFELEVDGNYYWVNPNGTKHLVEYSTRNLSHGRKLTEQQLLNSLQSATSSAIKKGYTYNVPTKSGNWELIFSPARKTGQLPVIKHAKYMP